MVDLTNAGVSAGVDQYLRAQALLSQVAQTGGSPTQPEDLSRLLAPLFATSSETQREFHVVFERWWTREFPSSTVFDNNPPVPVPKPGWVSRIDLPSLLIVGGLTLGLLITMLRFVGNRSVMEVGGNILGPAGPVSGASIVVRVSGKEEVIPREQTNSPFETSSVSNQVDAQSDPNGSFHIAVARNHFPVQISVTHEGFEPVDADVEVPTSTLEIRLSPLSTTTHPAVYVATDRAYGTNRAPWLGWLVILLPLPLGFLLRVVAIARRSYLRRSILSSQSEFKTLPVAVAIDEWLEPNTFRKAAMALQQRTVGERQYLDIASSIQRTVRAGGLPCPVFQNIQSIPEYLFLINRSNLRDHQAQNISALVQRLQFHNVLIHVFYYRGDPRQVLADGPARARYSISELYNSFPRHCLVLCSDKESMFDTLTGELQPWLAQIEPWRAKTLLTRRSAERDRVADELLALAGIELATVEHFAPHESFLRVTNGQQRLSEPGSNRVYPPLLVLQPNLGRDRRPPSEVVLRRLLIQLEGYLSRPGFVWLTACAVYPQLIWEITIHLGCALLGREDAQKLIVDLSELPWFRYGVLQDWLRLAVLENLSPSERAQVKTIVERMLLRCARSGSVPLRIAVDEDPYVSLDSWEREEIIENYCADRQTADVVLLSVLNDAFPSMLQLRAPAALRSLAHDSRSKRYIPSLFDILSGAALALVLVLSGAVALQFMAPIEPAAIYAASGFPVVEISDPSLPAPQTLAPALDEALRSMLRNYRARDRGTIAPDLLIIGKACAEEWANNAARRAVIVADLLRQSPLYREAGLSSSIRYQAGGTCPANQTATVLVRQPQH